MSRATGVEQSAWNLLNFRDDASTNQNKERRAWALICVG